MACEHKRLRCTDSVFYCLDCGHQIKVPTADEIFVGAKEVRLSPPMAEKPAKTADTNKAVTERPKRRTRKGATKA